MNKDSGQQPSPKYTEDEFLEQIRVLPPRSVTHNKRKETKSKRFLEDEEISYTDDESQEEKPQNKRSFPLIQIILYTFLAVIITFFIFWYWQEQQTRDHGVSVDPFVRLVERGGLNPSGQAGLNDQEEDNVGLNDEQEAEQEEPVTSESDPSPAVTGGSTIASEDKDSSNSATEDNQVGFGDKSDQPSDRAPAEDQPTGERKIIAEHIVQPGERLYRISMDYYGRDYTDQLAEFNRIPDKRTIHAGTTLFIPEMP